jgi:outer membrane lipoprotein-sorting protein
VIVPATVEHRATSADRATSAVNILRRLPLYRLLLLCAIALAVGVGAAALALALGSGPRPPAKPLAQAVHDALSGPSIEGVSANVKLTNRLLEGANLASGSGQGGEVASNPLLAGGSGRLWIASDGRARLELQADKGDTQVLYDGHTLSVYDAATNTLYRYTPPAAQQGSGDAGQQDASQQDASQPGQPPSLARIEEAIAHIEKHATLSGAQPDDVAGQPAYTVRVEPNEAGSLIGGAELSFDAANGAPLRAAVYSSTSQSPVIELAATEVSFGPVPASVFAFSPPPGAKVEEVKAPSRDEAHGGEGGERPKLTTHGHGPATIAVLEKKVSPDAKGSSGALESLPKVDVNGVSASELRTELGTLLTFERSGVRYLIAGAVEPGAVEALARGL